MTLQAALKRLLKNTGLIFKPASDNVILIFAGAPAPQVRDEPTAAYPEILVVGKRALNVDIARREDDIQPYRVIGADEIVQSGTQSLDDFFKSRVTSDAQALLGTQAPVANFGSARSQIDLRGLGTGQTLVLLDGHRLPNYPVVDDFGQSNINGIPPSAIARIELLSSTAGGIYGPDATGGVINIVLKHEAHGFDVSFTQGLTTRADAPNWRLDAHAGFTSNDGATKLDVIYSHAADAGLTVGSRPYVETARVARYSNLLGASSVLTGQNAIFANYFNQFPIPTANSVNFVGDNVLALTSQFGGGSIGSNLTFIPYSALGTPAEASILKANAGKLDFSLPTDGSGTAQSLLSQTQRDSLLVSGRQRLSDGLEAFVDVTAFRERGAATGPLAAQYGPNYIGFDQSVIAYPFTGTSQISYPPIAGIGHYVTTDSLLQGTVGLIASLSRSWRLETDLTAGAVWVNSSFPVANGISFLDSFGDPVALQAYQQALAQYPYAAMATSDRLFDGSIRMAGPLVRLPAGVVAATVVGEWRNDHNPGVTYDLRGTATRPGLVPPDSPGQNLDSQSLYGEFRIPVLSWQSPVTPLRGLELQLAGRLDHYGIDVPDGQFTLNDATFGGLGGTVSDVRVRYTMFAFTFGAKAQPVDGVMLRASYATGYQLPDPSRLIGQKTIGGLNLVDPKRGGGQTDEYGEPIYDPDGDTAEFDTGGSAKLKPARSRSFVVGTVISPAFLPGARASIDYTDIKITHDVFAFLDPSGVASDSLYNDPNVLLSLEDLFPGRVTRAPLTAADIANGYTAGAVTRIDASAANSASSNLRTIDVNLRYRLPTKVGAFTWTGQFSWVANYRRQTAPYEQSYSAVGYLDGPARWKGNAGVAWEKGAVAASMNAQVFAGYRVQDAPEYIGGAVDSFIQYANLIDPILEGRSTVSAQAYFDASLSIRVPLQGYAAKFTISMQNLFDTKPPAFNEKLTDYLFGDFGLGYSYYGDPRGRRFEAVLSMAL